MDFSSTSITYVNDHFLDRKTDKWTGEEKESSTQWIWNGFLLDSYVTFLVISDT